ncbi:MAG: S-methyl-5-thioribose-1-phosphate isomerase [Planctomycetota bacterium]|nr:MAG: S-methyl-5-thioribose-1-phosphate isomerase [Planctomycetota bacterium]
MNDASRTSPDSPPLSPSVPPTLQWLGTPHTGYLRLLDQTQLPLQCRFRDCRRVEDVAEAIRSLRVRGAPAIGVAAAYGVVLGLQAVRKAHADAWRSAADAAAERLAATRPTAVNLFWAVDRVRKVAHDAAASPPDERLQRAWHEAKTIEEEDRAMCAAIGRHGRDLMPDRGGVLTHCNAGSLATAGDGTALAVIYAAVAAGKQLHVYVDETRPLLQGARLTAWELLQREIPATLIVDSAAAWVMQEGRVQVIITGADRIAANGDTANKIGTYMLAQLAHTHAIPFYVAAPSSTFDLTRNDGRDIPIERRAAEEVTEGFGRRTAPRDIDVYNPAFDVTPAELIRGIITERGVISPVEPENIRQVIGQSS